MSWKDKYRKAVTFSYDDGVTQDIRLIELFNKYNFKGTFNLNSELLGNSGMQERNGRRISHYKIVPDKVRDIYEGHEVAVHTLTHPTLVGLPEDEIIRQVEQDRLNLGELTGYEIVGMAYPNGPNDDRVAGIIREHTGVLYSRTTTCVDSFDEQTNFYRFNPNAHHRNTERIMKMGHDFISLKPDKPQIFYIWGHSYEMDYESDEWMKFEEFLKLISNHDDIFYGTNAEVLLG